ncbi:MAG: zinc-ribbon domain-containing protein [Planctomycetota bacterium]
MAREFSKGRKATYYLGLLVIIAGLLLVCWAPFVFVDRDAGTGPFGFLGSFGGRAFGGVILIVIGGFLRSVGARGLAGSGVLLDAEKARADLEPYARIGGGLLRDGLEHAQLNEAKTPDTAAEAAPPEKIIVIRCRECRNLNEENSNFCSECGAEL